MYFRLLRTFACGLVAVSAAAQPTEDYALSGERPSVRAVRIERGPVLDGDVLGDSVWSTVGPVTGFVQVAPDEGSRASERTEVRVMYTSDTLFIGVVCYDRAPHQIIVADSRRDAEMDETDSFSFILDTYRDLQNGFLFGTNPVGIEYDAQVSNEGQGGGGFGGGPRAQGGSGGGLNVNWDGSWQVRARTGDYGWSAEFAVPFRTLRFEPGGGQVWGVNFERRIRRRNETAYWAPLPRQYSLPRVSLAGTLEGLELATARNLQVTPYVLAQGAREHEVSIVTSGPDLDVGVDAKYGITSSLMLDATINTDFAQVEADEQQINLDRFNLFFPEKRQFFLENAGVFSVGQPGEVELFFSRSIGIGPEGEPIPILGGARLSGDALGLRLGLLNMQTAQVGAAGLPADNFTAARIKRELSNRSFVGGLFTNRQSMGEFAPNGAYNRLAAADGQLGIGRYGLISGFAAVTFEPDVSASRHAFSVTTNYDSARWLLEGGFTEVSEGFNPGVGFLQRHAYRKFNGLIFHRFRPEFLGFHELRPHASFNGYWGIDGLYESGFLHVDNHWEWENGYEIHTGINFTHESVRMPFEIHDGITVPRGTYDHREAMLVGNTDRSRWVSLEARLIFGGFFGGDRTAVEPGLSVRAGDAFNSQITLSRNVIDLPQGGFTTNLIRARLSYSFTPRIYIQSLVQYNDSEDVWSANLRFGWLQSAGTGFFIVVNHTSEFDRALAPDIENQTLIIKYSRLLNVLD